MPPTNGAILVERETTRIAGVTQRRAMRAGRGHPRAGGGSSEQARLLNGTPNSGPPGVLASPGLKCSWISWLAVRVEMGAAFGGEVGCRDRLGDGRRRIDDQRGRERDR